VSFTCCCHLTDRREKEQSRGLGSDTQAFDSVAADNSFSFFDKKPVGRRLMDRLVTSACLEGVVGMRKGSKS